MEELAQRLQAMEARQQELVQELQRQQQRGQAAEQGLQAAQAELAQLRAAPAAAPQQPLLERLGGATVDTRTLGKPASFSGHREAWREFRFVFHAFACAAHANMAELFTRVEAMGANVVEGQDLDEATAALSRQLYYMLVMTTTDDAHLLLHNVEEGNGAEAWRGLCWEYEPDVRVRHGAVLHALLRREFGKDPNGDLAKEIESLERDVRRCENQSGKVLDEDVKISTLVGGMQNTKVRDHLLLNAARLDTFQRLRAEVLNFAVAKRTWAQDVDDPMLIGAVKDGKGKTSKGKGKDSKGKGKDSKGKAKTKDTHNPASGKECHYCGKPNHFKNECRKLKADIKAGKVDANGLRRSIQLVSGRAVDDPLTVNMIQPAGMIAAVGHGGVELALLDSGSGVVACPADYAPDVPMLPPRRDLRPMVSATSEPIKNYGTKNITYVLDNGEEMAITWNVTNVNCLILSASALRRGGATVVIAPEREMLHTASGGCVDLVMQSDVPWLRLRRQARGIRAARVPTAIEVGEPASAAEPATAEEVQPAPAVGPAAADAAPVEARAAPREALRRIPAPLDASEEARPHRSVKVPIGPSDHEKEEHYLTHIPFRSWCSYCTRAAAPDDPHHRTRMPVTMPLKPIVMMDYTFVTDPPFDMMTILTVYDQELGMVLALVVDEKGPIEYAIRSVTEYLGYWGRKAIILRVDGEPAIKALAEAIRIGRADPTVLEMKPRYSPESMGGVENMNKEVKNLLRTIVLYLMDVAKVELHTGHPLVPWLVRHCGWCICMYRVRADGQTGYERLKGRPYNGKIALFGECLWYRTPDASRLSSLDERWTTCIWLGKSWKTDEHIIVLGNEVRLARSVRRKAIGKRWNKKMLDKVLCTPWLPRLDAQTPAVRPKRYITKAYLDKYGLTPECPGCTGRTTGHSDTCKARFLAIWGKEDEALASSSAAAPAASAEAPQPAASGPQLEAPPGLPAPAGAAPDADMAAPAEDAAPAAPPGLAPAACDPAVDAEMEAASIAAKREREDLSFQEKVELFESGGADASGPASSRRRVIGALHVCGQPSLAEARSIATPVAYVATPDIGTQDVKDHKTGEVLDPELVRAGRARDRQNMLDRCLYERVPMKDARGKKVRSMWLDEKRVQDGETTVRSRCVAMEFNMYDRLDTYTATPPLKFIKLIVSRAASIRRPGSNEWTRVLGLYDIVTAFWHADLPLDEPITVIPPRGEEVPGMVWQMLKAMYGTRRASQLFLEFMVKVFDQCGYQVLKTSRQIFYSRQYDSLAGLWGDDIIAEAESEGIDHLDAMISRLCNIKVLPRVGPGCSLMGRYLKRYICYVPGFGYEWNEDPKHVTMLLESTGKLKAKPQGSPCSKHIGRDDPAILDELDGESQTKYRSDTGRVLYVSSGRFDIQYSAKELGEQMSTPRRLGNARLDRCARYLAGCPFLALVFKHEPEAGGSWIPVDSNWAEEPDRYSTHAGCEFVGSHLIESWVVTDQVRALSSAEAELYGIVDGAARGIMTQSLFKEIADLRGAGAAWSVTVGSDASAAIGISSRSGVGKTRHIATRWLWVQDAVREKQIILKKVPGETNIADLGTKALEPKRHQELMKLLPLAKPTCRRFLAVLVALGAAPATQAAQEAQEELTCAVKPQCEDSKLINYMLVALLTWGLVRLWDWARRPRKRNSRDSTRVCGSRPRQRMSLEEANGKQYSREAADDPIAVFLGGVAIRWR
ncbi:unnamed protein product [Prorocentrum cordatum]|uniref:Retrovirus-related Pol polyprotein from transposon TNT 1-94 n=1 Tax=Prorocentrum cordatum TaxID=2364126 RepID=A0ABN9TAX0_9DINO|nr:unnamed protein product [Polarella glacialis]